VLSCAGMYTSLSSVTTLLAALPALLTPAPPCPPCWALPHLQAREVSLLVAAVLDAQAQEQLHGLR